MTYNFTSRAKKAIEIANDAALELGHRYIGTEHLLYGLAKEGSGVASKVLENQEITPENIIDVTIELVGKDEPIDETLGFTPRTKRVLDKISLIHSMKVSCIRDGREKQISVGNGGCAFYRFRV